MKKIKYNQHITVDQAENMLLSKYPKKICPDCKQEGLYTGGYETQYDEINEEEVILSFHVFCNKCGHWIDKWDNTGRNYYMS